MNNKTTLNKGKKRMEQALLLFNIQRLFVL